MKIVNQNDIHLRANNPVNRKENYVRAQFDKLKQLVKFANDYNAYLFLGGDLCDSSSIPPEIVNIAMEIFMEAKNPVVATLGQHDIPFHQTEIIKSPVYSMWAANAIVHLQTEGFVQVGDVVVHFGGWEKKVSKPLSNAFNILLGHISVFENQLPHYWKGEGYTAKSLKQKYPDFDLYLCGDIHTPFIKENVAVSGSMMRISIDQKDYHPACLLIDTESMEIKQLPYNIEKDVFKVPENQAVVDDTEIDILIAAMQESAGLKNSYRRDCMALAKDDESVLNFLEEVFYELG